MTSSSTLQSGRRPAGRRPGSGLRSGGRAVRRIGPLLPALVLILVFFAGPIIWAFRTAFTNQALSGIFAIAPRSVGIDNFTTIFTDGDTLAAILRTVLFVLLSVLGQNLIGLLLAIAIRGRNRVVRGLVTVAVVGAWVIPEVVAAFAWYAFLEPKSGTLDGILNGVGLPGQTWLVSAPMVAVTVANIWRGSAFSMLIYSAAIGDVDPNIVEAAEVDGAGNVRKFWSIIIPSIRGIISTNLMLTTLQNLGVFGLIYAMTAGGPNGQSSTLPILMYTQAFQVGQIGYSNAISIVLLLIGAVFAGIYLRALRQDVR